MNYSLEHIKEELSKHHRDKSQIMEDAVTNRLNKSLLTYMETLDNGVQYIVYKSELNVLKKL